jgi:hypothetical protein
LNLKTILRSLSASVRPYDPEYRRLREREPVLAPYATARALLDALSPASPLTLEQRQPVVRAILREQQASPHPLWQTLLTTAFAPLLGRLRSRLRYMRDERDQLVLLAFLGVIAHTRVDESAPVFAVVRRATERALFQSVTRRRDEPSDAERIDLDAASRFMSRRPHEDAEPFTACLAHEIADHVVRFRGGEDVVRVLAGAETLADQAERQGSSQGAALECVRKRRQRAIRHVRRELLGDGPEKRGRR